MESFQIELFKRKIIAIIRNVEKNYILVTTKALYNGGIRFVEITFNQSDVISESSTHDSIKAISKEFGSKLYIGAGTVISMKQVDLAVDAGAQYIISPNINEKLIKYTKRVGVISIPGGLTPSEIVKAYECGADYVKLFPAENYGANYIKTILKPISHIPIIAVGGIKKDNMLQYINTGIVGVGIGSNLVNKTLINEKKFDKLSKLVKQYTSQIIV